MNRVRGVVLLAVAMLAAGLLAGCGESGINLPGDNAPVRYGELPEPTVVETVTAEVGEPVKAGIWTVEIRDVDTGSKYGRHVADKGTLVRVRMVLTNNTDEPVPVQLTDFVLANKDSYTNAVEDEGEYKTDKSIEPGKPTKVNAVFYIPEGVDMSRLTFAFANAARGQMRVETPVKE